MKSILFFSFFVINSIFANTSSYKGSRPLDVWAILNLDQYVELPSQTISYKDLFAGGISLIERSALRTLAVRDDILPEFQKLAHPNGVCLKGEWLITQDNPYSGLFRKNSQAIIIARASVALSKTKVGNLRGFGFAGKLFPTTDDNALVETANFFLIDDLGGTRAKHYTDVEMTNEPKTSATLAALANLKYALTLAATFGRVDANPSIRQVYEIADSTKDEFESTKSPKWMMIKAALNQPKISEADFRDELNQSVDQGGLVFDIYVSSIQVNKVKKWSKIGQISFNESVASKACDHQLHFHHPKWRNDIE
jgi:hypothetical protein